jgi:hypothetical protein
MENCNTSSAPCRFLAQQRRCTVPLIVRPSFDSFLETNNNIYRLDLKTQKQTSLTEFRNDFVFSFDWALDGRPLTEQTTKVADAVKFTRR